MNLSGASTTCRSCERSSTARAVTKLHGAFKVKFLLCAAWSGRAPEQIRVRTDACLVTAQVDESVTFVRNVREKTDEEEVDVTEMHRVYGRLGHKTRSVGLYLLQSMSRYFWVLAGSALAARATWRVVDGYGCADSGEAYVNCMVGRPSGIETCPCPLLDRPRGIAAAPRLPRGSSAGCRVDRR